MKIKEEILFPVQEFEKQHINKDKLHDGKITFLDVLKQQKKQDKKVFNVYEIAAKIAKGEFVSTEELKYLKENAPELYKKALMIYEENMRRKMNNKEGKQEEDILFMIEDENASKSGLNKVNKSNDGICNKVETHNSSLNMGEDDGIESLIQAL